MSSLPAVHRFLTAIGRAIESCKTTGSDPANHFRGVTKMVDLGSGAKREIEDFMLTRYACYLIAQNGDPRKEPIAFAQSYFAVQTRKQELIAERLELMRRLEAREKLRTSEKTLSDNIFERGVDDEGFGRIRSKGDAALFGGHCTQAMKDRLGVTQYRPLADFLPTLTIATSNPRDVVDFEKQMRRKVHYVIKPEHLWASIASLAKNQSGDLLVTLRDGFKYIENESFESTFQGLFSEINLGSEKLGKTHADKNKKLCDIIKEIADGLAEFSTNTDALGDAYEYLIGQFAAGSGKKAGEFYTPQRISDILSAIVTLDSQEPATGKVAHLGSVFDFACGSGSLLLNVRKRMGPHGIGKIFGQEKNITTYNLARMNMLLHGVKDTEFEIYHGDTLLNEWDMLRETNPAKVPKFDAVVANPPFSYRWEPKDDMGDDVRFKNHGLAPKSAADFAFLLHGFHYLKDQGVMAIILPHGVLFRGGAEERIRTKLLQDGHIDTVIGLPANLFYSTGIPVCILVLKKCKKPEDVLFINAAEHFEKGKRQNFLTDAHIDKIVETYRDRREEDRYSKRVPLQRIAEEGFNLNISRYISTAQAEEEIDLHATHRILTDLDARIRDATTRHNAFLHELGLPLLPGAETTNARNASPER